MTKQQENEEIKKGLGCETCQIHLEYMRLNDKIRELEQKLEQTEKDLADYQFNYPKIKELEKENEELRKNGFTVSAMTEQQLKVAIEKGEQLESENAELKQQIEKMKNCGNCKYGYCGGSSISIDKDGNRTFHNWNKEKQAYCDIGKNGKYQCWEIEK